MALKDLESGYYRKAKRRLDAITGSYDFVGKRVLDLGCSRGYFAFQLSFAAAHVVGVDGDAEAIAHDVSYADDNGIENVEFIQQTLTPARIEALGPFDAVLFLSVLHHIVTDSRVYEFIDKTGLDAARDLMIAIANITDDVLFFEIGHPDEVQEWAPRFPPVDTSMEDWVARELLHPAGFTDVRVIEPPEFAGLRGRVRQMLHRRFSHQIATVQAWPMRALRRATNFDTRDCRLLYVARRAPRDASPSSSGGGV